MDILASLLGTAAVAPGTMPAPAAPGADGTAFAAVLGLVDGAAPATGAPAALLPGFGPQPVAGLAVAPQPIAGRQPGELQAVPGEFAPEPWMTPRAVGKAPKTAQVSNMPTRIDTPILPEPELARPIAAVTPVITGKAQPVDIPAELLPELATEVPADPAAQNLLVAAALPVMPEPVARALQPARVDAQPEIAPTAELGAPAPAAKAEAPAPTPEPFTLATAEPIAREPVAVRAEVQPRLELAAPAAAQPASTPVPVQQAAPAQVVAAAAPVAPPPVRASLEPGFGERVGVAIARRVAENGDELTVRMEPAELGRIHVKLRFDEQGSLRAVLSAESAAVVDALRRDSGDLARALDNAGVRTDAQSFRFDRGGTGEQGQSAWARWQNQHGGREGRNEGQTFADEQVYRPVQRNGRLDLMA